MSRTAPIPAAKDVQLCIERCLAAYEACRQTRFYLRAKEGPEAPHALLKALDDCAERCRGSFDLLLGGGQHHEAPCPVCAAIARLCAEVCEECAAECRAHGGDPNVAVCAEISESCARVCRRLAP
jgi:hypothetical protein